MSIFDIFGHDEGKEFARSGSRERIRADLQDGWVFFRDYFRIFGRVTLKTWDYENNRYSGGGTEPYAGGFVRPGKQGEQ